MGDISTILQGAKVPIIRGREILLRQIDIAQAFQAQQTQLAANKNKPNRGSGESTSLSTTNSSNVSSASSGGGSGDSDVTTLPTITINGDDPEIDEEVSLWGNNDDDVKDDHEWGILGAGVEVDTNGTLSADEVGVSGSVTADVYAAQVKGQFGKGVNTFGYSGQLGATGTLSGNASIDPSKFTGNLTGDFKATVGAQANVNGAFDLNYFSGKFGVDVKYGPGGSLSYDNGIWDPELKRFEIDPSGTFNLNKPAIDGLLSDIKDWGIDKVEDVGAWFGGDDQYTGPLSPDWDGNSGTNFGGGLGWDGTTGAEKGTGFGGELDFSGETKPNQGTYTGAGSLGWDGNSNKNSGEGSGFGTGSGTDSGTQSGGSSGATQGGSQGDGSRGGTGTGTGSGTQSGGSSGATSGGSQGDGSRGGTGTGTGTSSGTQSGGSSGATQGGSQGDGSRGGTGTGSGSGTQSGGSSGATSGGSQGDGSRGGSGTTDSAGSGGGSSSSGGANSGTGSETSPSPH